jgi:hypothetical protein
MDKEETEWMEWMEWMDCCPVLDVTILFVTISLACCLNLFNNVAEFVDYVTMFQLLYQLLQFH